jgi:hypothetical protein
LSVGQWPQSTGPAVQMKCRPACARDAEGPVGCVRDGTGHAGLIAASGDCLKTGEACLAHCLYLLGNGDKTMFDLVDPCARCHAS